MRTQSFLPLLFAATAFLLPPPPAPTAPCLTPGDSNATLTVSSNDLPTLKLAFASVRFCIE